MTDLFATITAADSEASGFSPSFEAGKTDMEPVPHASRARAHAFAQACNLTVLALDLGTTTGFAIAPRGGAVRSGSFRLDPNKLGGNGRRWIAFREWLTATAREVGGVQVVYVEDVRRHVSNLSARVYCGYLAMLEAWCAANNVRLEGVGVGTIKKAFTGNGRADKAQMIAEAKRRGFTVTDDNESDAVALLAYGVAQES